MIKYVFLALATISTVHAATRVAVIELGKAGTVRRTTTASKTQDASADGVVSFWNALHGYAGQRKLQHAGMSVVPDLFSRPDSGVVIGLTGSDGVDIESLPTVRGLLTDAEQNTHTVTVDGSVVAHMEVHGQKCQAMMKKVQAVKTADESSLSVTFVEEAQTPGLSGIQAEVNSSNAAAIDAQIASLLSSYQSSGKTIVVHLVVEEDDGASRRRRLARRLEQQGEHEGEQEHEGEGENKEGEQNGNGQQNGNAFNSYYGYGYYNSYGEWVTPYKTMFEIQYFNVVLWTSVGLAAVLFFAIYLMVFMPLVRDDSFYLLGNRRRGLSCRIEPYTSIIDSRTSFTHSLLLQLAFFRFPSLEFFFYQKMADTLLFGESARVAYDD